MESIAVVGPLKGLHRRLATKMQKILKSTYVIKQVLTMSLSQNISINVNYL